MGYRLAEQNGESVAVPRLVFAHLAQPQEPGNVLLLRPPAKPLLAHAGGPDRGACACPGGHRAAQHVVHHRDGIHVVRAVRESRIAKADVDAAFMAFRGKL